MKFSFKELDTQNIRQLAPTSGFSMFRTSPVRGANTPINLTKHYHHQSNLSFLLKTHQYTNMTFWPTTQAWETNILPSDRVEMKFSQHLDQIQQLNNQV